MQTIEIHGKKFLTSIPRTSIENEVKRVAAEINSDYKGKRPLLLGVLNGAFMFVADLMRNLDIECEISFVKMSSYAGTTTTGAVKQLLGLNESIEGRDVIIVEDIIDTGRTLKEVVRMLKKRNPLSLKVVTLLNKPSRRVAKFDPDMALFTIPDYFVIGYGLDCDEYFRNLPYIAEYNQDAD